MWLDFLSQLTAGEHSAAGYSEAVISSIHLCFQGYEGLVEGGENIKPANWLSVSNIIQLVRLEVRWLLLIPAVCEHVWVCTRIETVRHRDLMGAQTRRHVK